MISAERHADYERRLGWVADGCAIPVDRRRAFLVQLAASINEARRGFALVERLRAEGSKLPGIPRANRIVHALDNWREDGKDDEYRDTARVLLSCHVRAGDELDGVLTGLDVERRERVFQLARESANRMFPRRGGPKGTAGRTDFQQFVTTLVLSVHLHGGTVPTCSKKGRDPVKGPLVNILRRLVPAELPAGYLNVSDDAIKRAAIQAVAAIGPTTDFLHT